MSGGVRVVQRPGAEASYGRAILKGMGVTLKHMLNPYKVTQQYPDEKWELAAVHAGRSRESV
jgi:formate hydrogenlyase subunit 6/NADH:ubiquinone oxidoreductase subunit I